MESETIQDTLASAMRKAGITDNLLAERLKQGLDANETKFFQKDGIVTDSRDVIAWSERRAYAELIADRIHGRPAQAIELSGNPAKPIEIVVTILGSKNTPAQD